MDVDKPEEKEKEKVKIRIEKSCYIHRELHFEVHLNENSKNETIEWMNESRVRSFGSDASHVLDTFIKQNESGGLFSWVLQLLSWVSLLHSYST